jgi:hypothetical protein
MRRKRRRRRWLCWNVMERAGQRQRRVRCNMRKGGGGSLAAVDSPTLYAMMIQ